MVLSIATAFSFFCCRKSTLQTKGVSLCDKATKYGIVGLAELCRQYFDRKSAPASPAGASASAAGYGGAADEAGAMPAMGDGKMGASGLLGMRRGPSNGDFKRKFTNKDDSR